MEHTASSPTVSPRSLSAVRIVGARGYERLASAARAPEFNGETLAAGSARPWPLRGGDFAALLPCGRPGALAAGPPLGRRPGEGEAAARCSPAGSTDQTPTVKPHPGA